MDFKLASAAPCSACSVDTALVSECFLLYFDMLFDVVWNGRRADTKFDFSTKA